MRKYIMLVALSAFLLCGCAEELRPTAWMLSTTDMSNQNEYIGRAGLGFEQTEAGIISQWWDDVAPHQTFGLYVLQYLPPDPNALPFLKQTYIGGQTTLRLDGDGDMYGPFCGTIEKLMGVDWAVEYQFRRFDKALDARMKESSDEHKVIIGPRFKF